MRETYHATLRPAVQLTAMAAVLAAVATWLFALTHGQTTSAAQVFAGAAYVGVLALSARRWSVPPLLAAASTAVLTISLLVAAVRWLIGRAQ
jgi:hypothetical protein